MGGEFIEGTKTFSVNKRLGLFMCEYESYMGGLTKVGNNIFSYDLNN